MLCDVKSRIVSVYGVDERDQVGEITDPSDNTVFDRYALLRKLDTYTKPTSR